MLAKPSQLEMADLKDRFGNFDGESIGHQQWPANILAQQFQSAKDVDVPPNNAEIETIARANIAISGNAVVQSDIDGNMLLISGGALWSAASAVCAAARANSQAGAGSSPGTGKSQ